MLKGRPADVRQVARLYESYGVTAEDFERLLSKEGIIHFQKLLVSLSHPLRNSLSKAFIFQGISEKLRYFYRMCDFEITYQAWESHVAKSEFIWVEGLAGRILASRLEALGIEFPSFLYNLPAEKDTKVKTARLIRVFRPEPTTELFDLELSGNQLCKGGGDPATVDLAIAIMIGYPHILKEGEWLACSANCFPRRRLDLCWVIGLKKGKPVLKRHTYNAVNREGYQYFSLRTPYTQDHLDRIPITDDQRQAYLKKIEAGLLPVSPPHPKGGFKA